MQYDRICRESTTMNWLVPQIMDEIRNKQTIVTTVMGCGWVRQSGRRVEQKAQNPSTEAIKIRQRGINIATTED